MSYRGSDEVSAITRRMSVDRFCATTPVWRTISGSRGNAIATRLLTSITALSALEPTSNVQLIVSVPLVAAVELK